MGLLRFTYDFISYNLLALARNFVRVSILKVYHIQSQDASHIYDEFHQDRHSGLAVDT